MDTRIALGVSRADVVTTDSASRVTPQTGAVPFRDMVARGAGVLLQGAEAAVSSLPGAPIVAAAVRPGGTPGLGVASASVSGTGTATSGASSSSGGLVPRPSAVSGTAESPTGAASSSSTGAPESSSVESTLAQSQEFNMYYLQLQEQLAAENRSYSAMSNVLKARHDTVKNAIGNIR